MLGFASSTPIYRNGELAQLTRWGAYGIAKTAVINFAEKLATECRGTPRINILEPGALASPMRARAYPGEDINQHQQIESVMPSYVKLMDPSCELNAEYIKAQEG